MAQEIVLRELSHGENAFYRTSLSNSALSKVSGDIPLYVLQASFEILLQRHALLQCCVREAGGKPYFTPRMQSMAKVKELEVSNYGDAENYFQQTMNASLDPKESFIEIICLKPSQSNLNETYIVSVVSHIISDGLSLVDLHRELFELCDLMIAKKLLLTTDIQAELDIPEPLENRLVNRPDGASVEDITKQYTQMINQDAHHVLYPDNHTTNDQHIEVLTHTLSEEDTQKILAWCKERRLSFNNVFTAAMLITANSMDRSKRIANRYLVRNAVNLRSKVEPALDSNVLITGASSILTSTVVSRSDDLEAITRKVSVATSEAILEAPYLENHIANKTIFKELSTTLAFHISNVGRLGIKSEFDSFFLEGFIMAAGTSCGKTMPIVVSTFNKRITILTHALLDIYPHQFVENLVLNTVDFLLSGNLKKVA